MEEFIKSIKPDTTPFDRFRDRIIEECHVSRQTFYNWSIGKPMEKKFKPIINKISQEIYGKSVFQPEEIQ